MFEYNAYKYNADATLLRGARWARDEEIRNVTRRIRLSDPDCPVRSGLPVISNGDTVYVDDSDAHSLIIGSTGSKKSRLFAMPMLEIIRRSGESVLVTDPKGELYEKTAQSFEDSGYRVLVINLRQPSLSNGWNPLTLARDYINAGDAERATAIVNDFAAAMLKGEQTGGKNDAFWEHTSIAMLQGLALMMVESTRFFPDDTVNLVTLRHLSEHFRQTDSALRPGVISLIEHYPEDSIARQNIMVASGGSEITFNNIKISYDAPMQKLYAQKSLIGMLSTNEIRFSCLGTEKTVLYLIMPDEKTTLHKIVSLAIKQCYEQLIGLAQKSESNTLPIRVNFLLDEFSNLPAIPDMPSMISAARSRNIKFHLIVQGLYQLRSKYGDDDAQTIKGNCGNWAFLTSRELPLLEEISNLCGQDNQTGSRLITVSQLQRLNKERGEALMLIGRQFPYIAHLADISQYCRPEQRLRPYPHIQPGSIRMQTVKDAMAIARQPKREPFGRPASPSVAPQKDEDSVRLTEFERRFDALFGNSSKDDDDC